MQSHLLNQTHAQKRLITSTCGGSNAAVGRALRKLAKKLDLKFQNLRVCYEAGPTGFVLDRRLIQLGLECVLCSPSKTERKPGEKIKTDKRDAQKLAKLYKNGDITPVTIPPELDESVRKYVARNRQNHLTEHSNSHFGHGSHHQSAPEHNEDERTALQFAQQPQRTRLNTARPSQSAANPYTSNLNQNRITNPSQSQRP